MINVFDNIELVRSNFFYKDQSFIFDRVDDLDHLVDLVGDDEFNDDERMPYWAELWPSAVGLSRYLINNGKLIKGNSVLELGCGMGLTSMVIGAQNPHSLIISDYEQEALDLAAHNFELNKLSIPETKLMDWRSPELDQKFKRIIASDVVYEERFFHPLLKLFKNHLTADGLIILAEPNRNIAVKFFKRLLDSGFKYEQTDEYVDQSQARIRVSIYLVGRD